MHFPEPSNYLLALEFLVTLFLAATTGGSAAGSHGPLSPAPSLETEAKSAAVMRQRQAATKAYVFVQQTKPNTRRQAGPVADDYDNICIAACAHIFLQPEVDFMHFATVCTPFKNYCATFCALAVPEPCGMPQLLTQAAGKQ